MKEGNWEARHGKKKVIVAVQMVVLLLSTASLLPYAPPSLCALLHSSKGKGSSKFRDSGFQEELPARVYQTFNFQKALQRLNKKYHFRRVHDENCLSS